MPRKNDEITLPILRMKKDEYEKLPINQRLQYTVVFKINKDRTITINKNSLCVSPDIVVPGFEPQEGEEDAND